MTLVGPWAWWPWLPGPTRIFIGLLIIAYIFACLATMIFIDEPEDP
jgi:hypothetical protein